VVHVTTLADDGPGSFRQAVTDSALGPRTIVFDVGGYIVLKSRLVLDDPFVTIAGQSAPAPGVCLRSAPFGVSGTSDAIVRFLELRVGGDPGLDYDGISLAGSDHSIIDHASVSWATDEAFSSRSSRNVTLQRTILAEALNSTAASHLNCNCTGAAALHGFAASIGGDTGSYHHNLLAHNEGRNWSLVGGLDASGAYAGRLEVYNNVVYNWGSRAADGGAHEVDFVGNCYKEGPSTATHGILDAKLEWTGSGTRAFHYGGNVLRASDGSVVCGGSDDECGRRYTLSNGQILDWSPWAAAPFFPSRAGVQGADDAYKDVLFDVGATLPVPDRHDLRVREEVRSGTVWGAGSVTGKPGLPDRESDVGGFPSLLETRRDANFDSDGDGLPDWWETRIGTGTRSASGDASDANADPDGDGFTNLEDYLDWMASPNVVCATGGTIAVNLAALTRGYANGPAWKAASSPCADLSIQDSLLTIAPRGGVDGCGVSSLEFTVVDREGSSKTRRLGLRIESPVDVEGRSMIGEPRWRLTGGRVGFLSPVPGTLAIRDVSGKLEIAIPVDASEWVALPESNGRVRLAVFAGAGIRRTRLLPPMPH